MKTWHFAALISLGLFAFMVGGLFRMLHWAGANVILVAALIFNLAGIFLAVKVKAPRN